MRYIFKAGHDQPIGEPFVLHLPKGAKIVAVGKNSRSDRPAFWFEFEQRGTVVERRMLVWLATGQPIEPQFHYVGTAHCVDLVWHLHEYRGEIPKGFGE